MKAITLRKSVKIRRKTKPKTEKNSNIPMLLYLISEVARNRFRRRVVQFILQFQIFNSRRCKWDTSHTETGCARKSEA